MLIWVTGLSGSGKSTVCGVLQQQGRYALDADQGGLSHWRHRATSQRAHPPSPLPPGWIATHAWWLDPDRVAELARDAKERPVFLFGSVENEHEVHPLCDQVVCFVCDSATLRHRLATRTSNSFGKQPEELNAILAWNEELASHYRAQGATLIDTTQPLHQVVRELLIATHCLMPPRR